MEQIDLFAETASIEETGLVRDAAATSPCIKHLSPSTKPTSEASTKEPFSLEVFLDDSSGLERTETQLLYRSSSSSLLSLAQEATQVTPTPGETVILDFSAIAWRAVIAWKNIWKQSLPAGAYFERDCQERGMEHVLHASLYVPHPTKQGTYFHARSVSLAVAQVEDVVDTLLSQFTEAYLSSRMLCETFGPLPQEVRL